MQGTIPSAAAARITISIAFLFPEFTSIRLELTRETSNLSRALGRFGMPRKLGLTSALLLTILTQKLATSKPI